MAEATPNVDIPVLTDAVEDDEASHFPSRSDTLIAELQTNLAASAFALTERLLHQALAEMQASVYEQVTAELRQELPELIDSVLRRHLGAEDELE
jgi:hypothetical protein